MDNLVLYTYFRSSASFRVRAALNLKKLRFETKVINLKEGQHLQPDFLKISPFSELPVLKHGDKTIYQSLAIILYLDETFPNSYKLFPSEPYEKAVVMNICQYINSGIHPLQNLKVGKKLKKDHGFSNENVFSWHRHWISQGFEKLEILLQKHSDQFCFKDSLTAADLFLVPQVYNALRYGVNLQDYPTIFKVNTNALKQNAVKLAGPGFQPDTPEEFKEKP